MCVTKKLHRINYPYLHEKHHFTIARPACGQPLRSPVDVVVVPRSRSLLLTGHDVAFVLRVTVSGIVALVFRHPLCRVLVHLVVELAHH